jgi:hypothetical protein
MTRLAVAVAEPYRIFSPHKETRICETCGRPNLLSAEFPRARLKEFLCPYGHRNYERYVPEEPR